MATKAKKTSTKGSKVIAGSGGLKNKRKLNWKILAPVLLVVVGVGGYLVYSTNAAVNYAFVHKYQNMSGGYVKKIGGVGYRVISSGQSVSTTAPYMATRNGGAKVCSHFKLLSKSAKVVLYEYGEVAASSTYQGQNSTYNICEKYKSFFAPKISVKVTSGSIGVDTIYGKR